MDARSFTDAAGVDVDLGSLGIEVINNMRGAGVQRAAFEAAVAAAQSATGVMLANFLPPPITDDEALTRTVNLRRGFSEDERFDKVKRVGGWAQYTFNVRRRSAETRWDVEGQLTYNRPAGKSGGVLDVSGLSHDAAARAEAAFAWYQSHVMTQDLSDFLASVFIAAGAVSIRVSGGVWFVPRSGLALANAAIEAIRALYGKAGVGVVNMADDGPQGNHRDVVLQAATDEFSTALATGKGLVMEFIEQTIAAATDPEGKKRGPRPETAERRLEDVKKLADKIALYADLLQVRMDDALKTASDLEQCWREQAGLD